MTLPVFLNRMKKRIKPGTIFSHKLTNGQFMFGQVLLDIQEQCIPKLKERSGNYLAQREISYVVRVFKNISDSNNISSKDILVPSITVDPSCFEDGIWEEVGFEEVDMSMVDFEEIYTVHKDEVYLHRGEVDQKTVISVDEYEDHDLEDGGFMNSHLLFDTALILLDREDLQAASWAEEIVVYDKKYADPEIRTKVYNGLGLDPQISYYDLAENYGCSLERFND